jgi:hypothetical protein
VLVSQEPAAVVKIDKLYDGEAFVTGFERNRFVSEDPGSDSIQGS